MAQTLLIGPSPLLAFAAIVAFVFAEPILRRPFAWALVAAITAIVVSTVAMWAMTGTLFGLLGLPFAAIAPVAFWFFVKALRIELPTPDLDG